MTSVVPVTHTFYGIINFDTPLECTKDVLGSKASVVVGGVTGVFELPSAADWGTERPDDPTHMPLRPPAAAATWKHGEELIYWGRPIEYPSGASQVEKALLTFEFPDDQMKTQATNVNSGLSQWYKLFTQYFELVTKQRRFSKIQCIGHSANFDLFRWGHDGKQERPYDINNTSLTVILSDDEDFLLKPNQFIDICALASSSNSPEIQYQIQLEAYRAMRNGDYREAIIETGIAAELGLLRAAKEQMSKSGITFVDELVKRFPALGGKLELARMVGVPLPAIDYQNRLVTPRNKVIHRGFFADWGAAEDAIKVTDELLSSICPSLQEKT